MASIRETIENALLQRLFSRIPIEGPTISSELDPMRGQYQKQVAIGSQRIKKYKDYSDMGEDSVISSALDIYASEVSQYDNIEKASVWVQSQNARVAYEVQKMLDNIQIEDHIFGTSRYLAQMGDNFIRPLINSQEGVVGLEQVDSELVERSVDGYNRLLGFRIGGKRDLLPPWALVHARIMARTASIRHGGGIYGTSMLENARRVWRTLTLLEDALVIYRLEIGGRHRVFYIDTGSVSAEQSLAITRRFKREFGKREYLNPSTGEWTSRFNPLNLTADLFFPVRSGSSSRIEYLGTDPNINGIVDIEHFRDKLYAALKIPKAYLGGSEYSSVRTGLAQLDVQFSRVTRRLQRAVIAAIYRLGQIHLSIRGINAQLSENDFKIVMSNISSLDQEQRLESLSLSIDIAARLRDLGAILGIPEEQMAVYIAKRILGLSSYDIQQAGYSPMNQVPGATGAPGELRDDNVLYEEIFKLLDSDNGIAREIDNIRKHTVSEDYNSFPYKNEGELPEAGMSQERLSNTTSFEEDENDYRED